MLTAQAVALNARAAPLMLSTWRNSIPFASCPEAQSQCRATWEAIAEVKNPRAVAFVRQAYIAAGPQQVLVLLVCA